MNHKIEFIAESFLGWEAQYLDMSKVPHKNPFLSYSTSYVSRILMGREEGTPVAL